MNDIFNMVIAVVVFVPLLSYSVLVFFSKKHKKKIFVVKKRETVYKGFDWTRKTVYSSNYTIDCKYDASEKIHTLGCSYDVYNQIKTGKTYYVYIKMLHIVSISKKRIRAVRSVPFTIQNQGMQRIPIQPFHHFGR